MMFLVIMIKVILDEVFGKSCDSIACDTCKYKEERISLRMLVMMKFMLNLNVEKQINLLNPT